MPDAWARYTLTFTNVGLSAHLGVDGPVATHETGRTKEHFFDLSLDLLCIQGFDGYFKELNPAWEATLGFMPEELKARPSISFVHPLDREATLAENRRIEDGLDTVSFENRYVCRDGSFKWLAWTAKGVPEERQIYCVARDITDRKQREDALSESEAGFRLLAEALERQTWTLREQAQILDLAYDAILVRDMAGRIIFWNRGAEELYGWTREEAIGQVSHELLRTRFPTSRRDVEAEVLDLGRWEGELLHTRRDGKPVVVDSRWALDRDEHDQPRAILEINNDITERKQAEEALRDSEERFRAVFEGAAIGIALFDVDGRVLESNRAVQEFLGLSAEELRGQPFTRFTHPEDAGSDVEQFQELVTGRRDHYQIEKRYVRSDGRVVWGRLTRSVVRGPTGATQYVIGMVEDIRLALIDELTGLNNRRAFFTLAHHNISLAARTRKPVTLLFVDVNNLKEINDRMGHAEGDQALRDTADVLTETFRQSDVIARIGGDEFCVLLTAGGEDVDARSAVDRLRDRVAAHNEAVRRPYRLSLSVGQSSLDPERPITLGELMSEADRSMYQEKLKRLSVP